MIEVGIAQFEGQGEVALKASVVGIRKDTRSTGGEVVEEAVGVARRPRAFAEASEVGDIIDGQAAGEAIVGGVVLEAREERESRGDRVAEGLEVAGGVRRTSGAYVKEVEARLDALVADPVGVFTKSVVVGERQSG